MGLEKNNKEEEDEEGVVSDKNNPGCGTSSYEVQNIKMCFCSSRRKSRARKNSQNKVMSKAAAYFFLLQKIQAN